MISLDQSALNKMLLTAANYVTQEIRRRTLSGIDVNGKPFEPYSAQYAKAKAKSGRGETVNLTYTNQMLGSITVRLYQNQAEIFIGENQRKKIAYYHHYGEGQPKREFFAVSDAKMKEIWSKSEKPIVKVTK